MDEICRLCCSTKFVNNDIFDEENALFIKMSLYLPIKLQKGDRLPQRICNRCSCKVNDLYQFCNEAIEVQNKFNSIELEKIFSYDREADKSIDVTLIKRDTDSPLLKCDKSTQTSEHTTNLPYLRIKEEPKLTVPAPIKEEKPDDEYMPVLPSDSDDEVLSKIQSRNYLTSPNVKKQENVIIKNNRKRNKESKVNKKKKIPEKLLTEININVLKEEKPDDEYMPVLPSDSDDEVLSKIQSRKYLTSPNIKEQENVIIKNNRKRNKESKVNKKKKLPEKLLTENNVNVLQEDNRVRPQDPGVDIDSLGENSHGIHFCCICFKYYTDTKADMLRHYKTHMNRAVLKIRPPRAPPLPAEEPLRCKRCRQTVSKAKHWASHWRRHWNEDRRLYHCGMCDLTFRNENNIYNHGKTHKPGEERKEQPKPYMCDSCPETFQFTKCLLAHRTRAHFEMAARARVLRCSTCKLSFTEPASLTRHQRVHTGERKYRCKVCGKTLTTPEILKFHMRRHTGYKPVKCSVCGKRFYEKSNLKKHMRVHSGEKPYECRHCGKAFSQSSTLVIHERYHTGERPYKCEHCGRRFVARALLTVHLKTCTDHTPKKIKGKVSEKKERSKT